MVGGGAAARGGEEIARGLIAKAAKSVLRDAERADVKAGTRDLLTKAEGTGTRDATEQLGRRGAGSAADDATRHVDLGALPEYHQGGQPDLFGAQNVPADYKPYGDLSRQDFYDEYWNEAGGHWDYPGNDGFAGPARPNTAQPGDMLDRYGLPGGTYTSPADTSFERRALPPTNLTAPYFRYEVVRPLPAAVTEGPIAPAFEQTGGGLQQFFDRPIQDYVDDGYLKQVYP